MATGRSCLAFVIFLILIRLWLSASAPNRTNYSSNTVFQLWRFSKPTAAKKSLIKLKPFSTRDYTNLDNFVVGLLLLCGDVACNPGPVGSSESIPVIKCMVSNTQSLKSLKKVVNSDGSKALACNLHQFQDLVYSEDMDVVCVNETWLNESIDNSEILKDNYIIFRKDRSHNRAGGVLVAIKIAAFKTIGEIPLPKHLQDLEVAAASVITSQDRKILFCSFYRPPDMDLCWINLFNKFLDWVCEDFDNMVICGDFNYPKISWDAPDSSRGVNEQEFVEALHDHYLTQIQRKPTRGTSVLDLVITSVPDQTSVSEVLEIDKAGLFTDHRTVFFEFHTSVKASVKMHRSVYDYAKGDFDSLRNALRSVNLTSMVGEGDLESCWQTWKDLFLAAVKDNIPTKRLRGRNPVPWLTGAVINLIKKKETARRKLKLHPSVSLKAKFQTLRSQVKSAIREIREEFFESANIEFKINPKRLWSVLKTRSKSRNIPQSVSMATGNLRLTADSPEEIADMFNNYFTSVFSAPHEDKEDNGVGKFPDAESTFSNIVLHVGEVEAVLKSLDPNKATGPDEIPARILKVTATIIAPSLCKLFNRSLGEGYIPSEWKLANVVPVYKKDEKDHVENYRPISLLCVISKVLERCVLNRINVRLQDLIADCQHGFRSGRSCVTNLLETLDYIGAILDRAGQVDCVYLDMSKAFDKVRHDLLMEKLRDAGLGGNLLTWFRAYLYGRRQRVTVLGATSRDLPVTSGVPQGSILGPALFLLYVNNLPDSILNSKVAMFADDTKVYKVVISEDDSAALQQDLDNLSSWSVASGLAFNDKKCKFQTITRKRKPICSSYEVNGNTIMSCEEERDLGVSLEPDLTWHAQVSHQAARANKLLGFVRRNSRFIHSISVRRTLYLGLVRAHLGYATQVWAPQGIELISKLERIQRRATKFILCLPFLTNISYKERLIYVNLLPVCYWHELLDLIYFYKATHNMIHLDPSVVPFVRDCARRTRISVTSSQSFVPKRCRTSTFQKSFFIRTTRIWNLLITRFDLENVTFGNFKSVLYGYYSQALAINYDPDSPRSFKSICLKCNTARFLDQEISCCM